MHDSVNFAEMITLEQLIGELLLRHNCVVIPSFGGFVAKKVSATIDFTKGTIAPPRKNLLFNRQLVNNDGLLISEFARINELSYNDACSLVDARTMELNATLRKGERITIDKVGFLYFDQEKNICFEQDRFFNLLMESYGLGSVHFVPQEEEQPQLTDAIASSNEYIGEGKIIELPTTPTAKSKVWKYVAAACLLPIAFYSFWLPVNTNVLESGMLSVKDFNPFYHQQNGEYIKAPIKQHPSLEKSLVNADEQSFSSGEKVVEMQIDDELSVRVQNDTSSDMSEVHSSSPSHTKESFDLIVGCFSNVENAENFILSLKAKGIDAYLYDIKNDLRRISAGSRKSIEAVNVLRNELDQLGVTGWILKK